MTEQNPSDNLDSPDSDSPGRYTIKIDWDSDINRWHWRVGYPRTQYWDSPYFFRTGWDIWRWLAKWRAERTARKTWKMWKKSRDKAILYEYQVK